jgi:hypothetical protein
MLLSLMAFSSTCWIRCNHIQYNDIKQNDTLGTMTDYLLYPTLSDHEEVAKHSNLACVNCA